MKILPKNIICLSHLRWDFVFQRPQHLLTRFSENFNIYYMEEPIFDAEDEAYLTFSKKLPTLFVGAPHLPPGLTKAAVNEALNNLLKKFFEKQNVEDYAFWYYTPMALEFSDNFNPGLIVYDCMDELSAFKFAPQELKELESKLMMKAHLVFTGGQSLYEAKKKQHFNIHPFPSSIDKSHFGQARKSSINEPEDQVKIKGCKLGFYGVIDERFDIELIREIANQRPDWQIVLLGPVVKIDPETLPKNPNIHYLGSKSYQQLPQYLSGWDIALIPFMINESTRFISPTKTPEYLSGGVPVVSTPIRDVVQPYGTLKLVSIASSASDFIEAIEKELNAKNNSAWLEQVDKFLSKVSWEITVKRMQDLMTTTIRNRTDISIAS
ncbi:MAG: glycosyl transferase [Sphingobacteriales bacterium]|nr:glycosyl transferase [Sphingobacteriales bacterium]